MTVVWTKRAERDVSEIIDYVLAENPHAALSLRDRIYEAVGRLTKYPHLGRVGQVPDTRELVITQTPFIAAYRVVEGTVFVLAVVHGARRWPERL